MNNTTMFNTCKSYKSNITNITTQHQQVMKTITKSFLKFKLMITI